MTAQQGTTSGSSTSEMREELSQDASQLKDTAQQRAKQEAENRKSQAAQVAGSASSAFDAAASELESDQNAPDWLGSAMRQAAGSIDRVASEMEGRDVSEIGQQVSRFARTNPGSFLAASAAAGFAAARVLRAGAEHRQHHGSGQGNGAQTGSVPVTTPTRTATTPATPAGGPGVPVRTTEGTAL